MLRSLWTRGCSVLLIGVSLLGNGLPWQRAADDPYAFVPEPENTVQIACVGNSDLYSGFVPPVLWGNQGYSATVYASARQSLTKSYALLERVFATQSPELVVLETDLNNYLKEAIAKFIIGELPFEEWDTDVETLNKIGLEEWVSIYQDAFDLLNK